MRRQIAGLHSAAVETDTLPDGLYLVEVRRAQYRWHPQKPFYNVRLHIFEPKAWAASGFSARLYCSARALWKLAWFLRDFGYDSDLLATDEIDEQALVRLRGVVQISHTTLHGTPTLNLEGFAPAEHWQQLSSKTMPTGRNAKAAP
jgi:hypothetical protein